MSTVTADPVSSTFAQALAKDAGHSVAAPPDIPPPPPVDPAAPHGRDGDGKPLAPYGFRKSDGLPNKKPPGPGRPRTASQAPPARRPPAGGPSSPSVPVGGEDIATDLGDFADSIWLGLSGLRGGRIGPVRLPDTRPYALAWHQSTPQLVVAWTQAARQNATVRGYVGKLSGDGSMAWVIGVGVAMGSLASAAASIAGMPAEDRAKLAAANDAMAREYAMAQVEKLGLELEADAA